MDGPWRWRPADIDDVELRYGLYRAAERLEGAVEAVAIGRAIGTAGGAGAIGTGGAVSKDVLAWCQT